MIKIWLKVLVGMIILVWAIGYFLFWGEMYAIVVLSLIILALVMVLIGFITDDSFL
ncbi:MAG: hypothetical protein ACO2ZZ_12880 [Cyclobacteriaceae bacterium]